MKIKTNPEVELLFKNYPESVQDKMLILRGLVIETAKEIDGLTMLEETLKWGEPNEPMDGRKICSHHKVWARAGYTMTPNVRPAPMPVSNLSQF